VVEHKASLVLLEQPTKDLQVATHLAATQVVVVVEQELLAPRTLVPTAATAAMVLLFQLLEHQ
jgi:hypothetical protein